MVKNIIIALMMVIGMSSLTYPDEPTFVSSPAFWRISSNGTKISIVGSEIKSKSVYEDVITHYKGRPFGDGLGRMTNVHETTHFINKQLRTKYAWKVSSGRINCFYVLDNKAVILAEPNIKKQDIIPYVPDFMKDEAAGSSYSLYIKSDSWNDSPLYIFDEWVAYTNEAMCGIDDVRNGVYKDGNTNGMEGALDFSIYAISLGMAVRDKDPGYWNENPKFRSFLQWNFVRAMKAYQLGSGLEQFKYTPQERTYLKFINDSKIQSFLKELTTSDN